MSTKTDNTNPSRKDWTLTDQKISEALVTCMKAKKNKVPTLAEVANAAGCSIKTVQRHLDQLTLSDRFSIFKGLTDKVIMAIFKGVMEGKDPRYIELWFKYVENYSDKSKVELSGESIQPTIITLVSGKKLKA